MRFFLLILISISSNFLWSNEKNFKNFICDIPYRVTPDLRHRAMVRIGGYEAMLAFYEESEEIFKEGNEERYSKVFKIETKLFNRSLKITEDRYEFGNEIYIDRYKGEMTDFRQGRITIRNCKSVTYEESQRVFKEWEEYASERTKIWNAERKNQLDSRKL